MEADGLQHLLISHLPMFSESVPVCILFSFLFPNPGERNGKTANSLSASSLTWSWSCWDGPSDD